MTPPPSRVRDWPAWAAVWTLALQSPMWVAIGVDAVQERYQPTMGALPVPGWMPVLGTVLAVAVPAAFLLSVLGGGVLRPRRSGLVLGGLSLLLAAVGWTGTAQHDTEEWYVGLSALAGVCALLGAAWTRGEGDRAEPRWASGVAGAALVAAGAFTVWTCLQGGAYWDWQGQSAVGYRIGLGVGAAQVLLGLLIGWTASPVRGLRWTLGPVAGLAGTRAVLVGVIYFFELGVLYRWNEEERVWDVATPVLIAGFGSLATAVAAWRRRADLVGLSFAATSTVGVLALWQESTWGSVMS